MTILNNIIASYGANVVAAVGIANKINQLPIQIVFAYAQCSTEVIMAVIAIFTQISILRKAETVIKDNV